MAWSEGVTEGCCSELRAVDMAWLSVADRVREFDGVASAEDDSEVHDTSWSTSDSGVSEFEASS